MEYPREVGIVKFNDGTYDCYPNCVGIAPSVDYIQKDIAQSLADALEFYAKKKHVQENVPDADGSIDLCLEDGTIARAALANYRKGAE